MMARLKPRPEQGSPSKNRGKWWEHALKLLESPAICTGEAALPPLQQHPAPSASPQAVLFAGPWQDKEGISSPLPCTHLFLLSQAVGLCQPEQTVINGVHQSHHGHVVHL